MPNLQVVMWRNHHLIHMRMVGSDGTMVRRCNRIVVRIHLAIYFRASLGELFFQPKELRDVK